MIIRDGFRESTSSSTYTSTSKDPAPGSSGNEQAYWLLSGQIEEKFGGEPATISEIYHQVTGPFGLTSQETIHLVRAAKREGYLR